MIRTQRVKNNSQQRSKMMIDDDYRMAKSLSSITFCRFQKKEGDFGCPFFSIHVYRFEQSEFFMGDSHESSWEGPLV